MLVGHNSRTLTPIIYSFHMPLFFVLAGYTIKIKHNCRQTIYKDFKRLIVPCIITKILISFGNCLIYQASISQEIINIIKSLIWGNHYGDLFGIEFPSIGRIWFLDALFWTRILYRLSLKYIEEKKRLPVFSMLSIISMLLGTYNIVLPQNMDMIFICLFFVEVGHIMKEYDLFKIPWYIFVCIFTIWTYLSISKEIWISMNMRMYPGYGLCILVALVGCICVFMFSRAIEKTFFSKILIFYGKNSLILLVMQALSANFFIAHNNTQKVLDMLIECTIVIAFVYIKEGGKYIWGMFKRNK